MYFPYFYGGQYEADTVFKLKQEIENNRILPIFDIFKTTSHFVKAIYKVTVSETPYILIQNSLVHISNELRLKNTMLIESLMKISNNKVIPGFYINPDNLNDLKKFLNDFKEKEVVLFHTQRKDYKTNQAILQIISQYKVKHNIFLQEATTYSYRKYFSEYRNVIIEDYFKKRTPNSAYKEFRDEYFHNLHYTYKESGYYGFGDYLTIGSSPSMTRTNPPSTIVIHFTYPEGINKENIRIRRFFGDVAEKFSNQADARFAAMNEAKEFIIQEISSECSYCCSCDNLLKKIQKEKSYNLGELKQFSMLHHSHMMMKLINT